MSQEIPSSLTVASRPSSLPTGFSLGRKTSITSHENGAVRAHLLHFGAKIDNSRFVCSVYAMQRCTPVQANQQIDHGISIYRDFLHHAPALDVAEHFRQRYSRSLFQSFAFPMYNSKQEQI